MCHCFSSTESIVTLKKCAWVISKKIGKLLKNLYVNVDKHSYRSVNRVIYPSPFKLHRCWLRSLTPIIYYFVGSRGFAHLPPKFNLKSFGYRVLSSAPETTRPSGSAVTDITQPSCPSSVAMHSFPLSLLKSHTFRVLS